MFEEESHKLLWLLILSISGGALGITRKKKDEGGKKLNVPWEMSASIFCAVITYLTAKHFLGDKEICIAAGALAAFIGADMLILTEKIFIKIVTKWGDKL